MQQKDAFWTTCNHCIYELTADAVIYKDLSKIQSLHISSRMTDGETHEAHTSMNDY